MHEKTSPLIIQIQNKAELTSKISFAALGFAIPISVAATSICLTITIISLILAGNWRAKYKPILTNKVAISAIILFFAFIIGSIYSSATLPYIIKGLHKYDKLLLIPLLMPAAAEKKWQKIAIYAFLGAIIINIFLAYTNALHLTNIYFFNKHSSPMDVFRGHIDMSFFIAIAAYIFAHRTLTKTNYRWTNCILFLLTTYALLFLNTGRTGYLVFAVLICILFWQQLRWKGVLTAIIVLPLFLTTVYFSSDTFRTGTNAVINNVIAYQYDQQSHTSIGFRMLFMHNSLILIKKHPVIGYGTGSFKPEFMKQFGILPGFPKGLVTPHNEYLLITTQLGIIGLILYLCLLLTQIATLPKLDQDIKPIAQAVVAAFIVGAFCNSMFYTTATGHFFVYFTALLWAPITKKHEQTNR